MSCVPRAFVRLLARSFVQVFSNGSPIARSLAPLDGGFRWSERAVHVKALADCTDWMEAGHPYARLRLGMRNERTQEQMLTLDTKFLAIYIVGEAIQSKEGLVCVWHFQCHLS